MRDAACTLMGNEHEGQIDQWQGGSVTPRDHNLKRGGGSPSRREERLAEPPSEEPSGREQRRSREREADDGEADD
jgi:hypothetical protein